MSPPGWAEPLWAWPGRSLGGRGFGRSFFHPGESLCSVCVEGRQARELATSGRGHGDEDQYEVPSLPVTSGGEVGVVSEEGKEE